MEFIKPHPSLDIPVKPHLAPVERGHCRADVQVPSKIWLLPIPGRPTTIMIREEYQEIMLGILRWMEHRMKVGLETTSKQEDMDVGFSEPRSWLEEPPAPGDLGVVQMSQSLSDMMEYPNPFTGKAGVTTSGGLVLTGLPGIGKSSFLWVLFNLRCAAGLPTLFLTDSPSSTILWKDYKSYQVDLNTIPRYALFPALPRDTWCLVDSHSTLASLPEPLITSSCFKLQAASPRKETMQWMKKVLGTFYFIMKPWDLGELIAGQQCQETLVHYRDETQLANFYDRYGGSARDAYAYAPRPADFEVTLSLAFDLLQTDYMTTMFKTEPSRVLPESTSHLLLSYFPVDNRNRTVWKLDSPSTQLRERLLARTYTNYKEAQKAWFQFNLGSPSPGCKAMAAYMFDGFYHEHITGGGSWALQRMIANEERHPTVRQAHRSWKIVEGVGKVLIAEKAISVQDESLVSIPVMVPDLRFDDWPVDVPFLVGVYHRPNKRSFPTFDSFFVDKVGHAITFQSSIAMQHGASPSGQAFLEQRGIHKVTYVYVTPTAGQTSVSLPLAVDSTFTGFYDSVYHMHLDYQAL